MVILKQRTWSSAVTAAFLGILLLAPVTSAQTLTVARVVDGDTFELSDGRRVRLIGIDTPEKHSSAKLQNDAEEAGLDRKIVQALGAAASDYARMLVQDRRVELEFDQANAASNHADRYGRTLAYVWVLDEGVRSFMANRRLVADGYAHAYTRFPFAYAEEFLGLERQARRERRGLWADGVLQQLSGVGPAHVDPDEAALVGSVNGRVYHLPSCRHARNIRSGTLAGFRDAADAAARGYRPCRVCKP